MITITLDLNTLYSSKKQKDAFLERLDFFYKSDKHLPKIIKLKKNNTQLTYSYNELHCNNISKTKKTLILVFGNPSPHSIKEKIMFSYEGKSYNIHRVWRVLNETGIISLDEILLHQSVTDYKIKGLLRNNLIRIGVASNNFNLSMLSYFSFPSASSELKWSGVAGIKKLFGRDAWSSIKSMEYNRFLKNLESCSPGSKVLVFQKDAYVSILENNPDIDIELMSPTRLWYSHTLKQRFNEIANHMTTNSSQQISELA